MAIDQNGNYVPDLTFGTTQPAQPSFGFGAPANPYAVNNSTVPNLNFNQPTQPAFNPNQFSNDIASFNQPQQQAGFFDSVSGGDWLNFGSGLLQAGLGAYYQNQALDQSQQSLDLSRDKYNNYLQEQERMREADARRTAASGR